MSAVEYQWRSYGKSYRLTGQAAEEFRTFYRQNFCAAYGHQHLDATGCSQCGMTHQQMALRDIEREMPASHYEDEPDETGYYRPIPSEDWHDD